MFMNSYLQINRLTLIKIYSVISLLFFFFVSKNVILFYSNTLFINSTTKKWYEMEQHSADSYEKVLPTMELSLCSSNLLSYENYDFKKWAERFSNSTELLSKIKLQNSCTLLQYSVAGIVNCFDVLYEKQISDYIESNNSRISNGLHFAFIGDSRIRQQFFYFLKMVPDYDRITQPIEIPRNVFSFHHGDVEVESIIMKLRVSYKWQPIINDTLLETLHDWTISNQTKSPDLIFLSIEVHHMLKSNGANFKNYEKKLREIAPILEKLAKSSKVIWLNQYPTIEFYGETHEHNTYVHSEKIFKYNEAVRRIFKNYGTIKIWDSSNPFAQEYVRGCAIFNQREIPKDVFVKEISNSFINCKSYINCNDYIHTGYVALSQATQLLYNDICNFK